MKFSHLLVYGKIFDGLNGLSIYPQELICNAPIILWWQMCQKYFCFTVINAIKWVGGALKVKFDMLPINQHVIENISRVKLHAESEASTRDDDSKQEFLGWILICLTQRKTYQPICVRNSVECILLSSPILLEWPKVGVWGHQRYPIAVGWIHEWMEAKKYQAKWLSKHHIWAKKT